MKMSQWRRAVENSCVFGAWLKVLSDRFGDRSAGGRRFHVAGPLTTKLRPVAVRACGTSRVPVAADDKSCVTRRYSVQTLIHILRVFPLSGNPNILVFPHQTVWGC